MGEYDLCVNLYYGWIWFMYKSELWVGGGYTHKHTSMHTHTPINTMTMPDLGAGPSENPFNIKPGYYRVLLWVVTIYSRLVTTRNR